MNTDTTLTWDVAARLQADIEQGTYAEMSRLPSERELAETLGVSRVTVRRALKELELAHFIHRRATLGTFVNPKSEWQALRPAPTRLLARFSHVATDFRTDAHFGASARVLRARRSSGLLSEIAGPYHIVELQAPERIIPSSYIGNLLYIIGDLPAVRRLRLVTEQGTPLELWDTYYAALSLRPIAPDIVDRHVDIDGHALDQWLREQYGTQPMRVTVDGQVRFPTEYEAYWLHISRQTPVVDLERVVRDPRSTYIKHVELSRIVAPTYFYSFVHEYEQDGVEPASWHERTSS